MPHKRLLVLLVWGVLAFSLLTPISIVHAQDDSSLECEFQPLAANRISTSDAIRPIASGGLNITWDNTYPGLHRWDTSQWPGVDYVVDTTVAFKNGAVVSWVGWDGAGGGNSLVVDGVGPCEGWRIFYGHLNYDPTTRYQPGDKIGPDEIVGEPGCSGFDCSIYVAHNHVTLGYWSNIFNFEDGTIPINVRGYWWIHPSRVEGSSPESITHTDSSVSSQSVPSETDDSLNSPTEGYTTSIPSVIPFNQANIFEKIVISLSPFRNLLIILTAALVIVVLAGIIYSPQFRKGTLYFIVIFGIISFLWFKSEEFRSYALVNLTPPRDTNAGYVTEVLQDITGYEISSDARLFGDEEELSSYPEVADINPGTCADSKYPDSVRRWCDYIEKYSANRKFDPLLISAVILQESGGNPQAYSSSGAAGLMQVMASDGISAGFMCVNGPCFADRPTIAELEIPETNIDTGTRILRQYVDYCGGDLRCGLMHYGPDPEDLLANYGSEYYYADLILAIFANYQ